ncbi:hypothetical protein COV17_00440 [Candidatus Woesearchaeota archaeon CG10_big_fil_rev_8_21_14_0_10_36_11]|nr:MAG: hypothetical protein COV17_00440 [Candidatus Woesearchaeota archaeon CG10_big_fil_rev_8_21_14_0_10_36_11]
MAKQKSAVTKKKENGGMRDKVFWVIVSVVFMLSAVVILTNINLQTNLTGNSVVQTISYMKAGNEMFLETKTGGIQEIVVTFNEDVKNSLIKTEEVDDVSWDFDGIAYSKVKISSVVEDKINEGIKVTLKIKESDLLPVGISQGDIRLFVNGKELETVFDKSSDGYLYYTSVSPSLGEFIIGKETVKAVEEVPEPIVKEPIVGKAIEEPVIKEEVVEEKIGFFAKIGNFFKELFA